MFSLLCRCKYFNYALRVPCGSRKNTTHLASAYQPRLVESKWQKIFDQHEEEGDVKLPKKRRTFRMILPPPNVTGNLHLGHALNSIIQDVLCRQHQQLGYDIEWIPGTDHAGIATQVVIEKKLLKERGLSRHQIGRKLFLEEVYQWKQEKGTSIVKDLRNLGCMLSWDKEYFTMDKQRIQAVNSAFIKLFEEGLIERRMSLVNWSCTLESAISDIEVDNIEVNGTTEFTVPGYQKNIVFGRLYDISYRICDSDEEIVVSTTRPETLLGDVAVAVHPEDERYIKYRHFPEVKLWHPFRQETIPLIFDVSVERNFGTGAVKITPAHDKKDFEIGKRHLLKSMPVFDERGNIIESYEGFKNMPRFEAREHMLRNLAEMHLLREVRDHAMTIPICSRTKDIIEYMLRPQWFLSCQSMADAALSEVNSGRLRIVPSHFETEWERWLKDCHDWCISRQLWWGHRIPIYFLRNNAGETRWIAALSGPDAISKAKTKLSGDIVYIEQDGDVLDTWFSSALLPFSAFNWPDLEYQKHYPLDLMVTGHDIIFFWVARMVMLGLKLTGELPFKKVLLNGIVCDAHGRKMSKSLGNVVTPQQVIQGATTESLRAEVQKSFDNGILSSVELNKSLKGIEKMFPHGIQECGTDALRFTLCSHNIKHNFINFNIAECHTNKLFFNKIWQATRYTLGAAEKLNIRLYDIESISNVNLGIWDQWILSRLAHTLKVYAESFDNYNLHIATAALKQFFYNNLCDTYLETTKANINSCSNSGYIHCATIATCLSWGLQALSPFAPYVAEELLEYLPHDVQINFSKIHNLKIEREISEILNICQCIRQLKSRNKIVKKHDPHLYLFADTPQAFTMLKRHLEEIKALTLTNGVYLEMNSGMDEQQQKRMHFFSTAGHMCAFGLITNEDHEEIKRKVENTSNINQRKLQKLQAELTRYHERMKNNGFLKSASEEVQKKHLRKIQQLKIEIQNMKDLAS